ncbi:hypothetical protein POM88_036354 [Heracleum sosnowskyi]|uniref:Homoserine dehydrogenase n=1 Tax=Heracleum sosnowskyi TaxID=360622 RepID=A0AAD8MET2_9APIA|nr:hypothetical protein POM88_036354 [Heracleum sosnowskyi]
MAVMRSISYDHGNIARVGAWCWTTLTLSYLAMGLNVVHFVTFYAPLWGAIIFNGIAYFQVIRMPNNAACMAVGMSDRAIHTNARTDMKKIRGGKLEEIVDPVLYYHEQPAFVKEQIERPPISGSDIYRTKDGVELAEFDIKSLKQNEIKDLLNRLVKIPEKDNEGFLLKLKQRMDRVGLKVPTIEVRFQHLNVTAEAYVGSRALPTIQNSCANMLEGFLSYLRIIPTPKKPLPILQDVSGIIKPGRMVLLLGPPTSGKTTLLLALAGKLGSDLQVSGRVTYNGCDLNEFVPQRTSSEVVSEAKEAGYTEPDPRDDLAGTDVARKVIILARESGLKLHLQMPTAQKGCLSIA